MSTSEDAGSVPKELQTAVKRGQQVINLILLREQLTKQHHPGEHQFTQTRTLHTVPLHQLKPELKQHSFQV